MLPSVLAREVTEGLKQFIITGFETSTPFFQGLFTRFVETPGNLYKGPYLSLALPFQQGTAESDFFAGFTTRHPPFLHQERAWQRLSSAGTATLRSTLIATGTGSGKTECFLYPLLDHCQRHPGPGIKAVVIYPMNALANDQAKRFAEAIHASLALRGRVRVGLFVGAGEDAPTKAMTATGVITDKNTLREAPPDILLTNYKMLDYLLIRPRDRALWRHNGPQTLRYLVVDELHTFDGAQGTDLACLIRRLKARLAVRPDQLICIGTSATLGSGAERETLLAYAERIFQARFEPDSLIGEARQAMAEFLGSGLIEYQFLPASDLAERLEPERYHGMADYLAAQYALLFPDEAPARPQDSDWCAQLGAQLKKHLLFHNLLRLLERQPRRLDTLAAELAKSLPPGAARELAKPLLTSLGALIACARDPRQPALPLVQLRLQLWVRELRRMVTRVARESTEAGDRKAVELLFADDVPPTQEALYLPLVQCSECHATAWAASKSKEQSQINADLRTVYNAFFQRDSTLELLFPLQPEESPPAAKGRLLRLCGGCGQLQNAGPRCQQCGAADLLRVFLPDNGVERESGGVRRLEREHHCPVCGARHSMRVFGARAASLASVAIQHSYASPFNDDKKLIAFSDAVQDAAHRAGFFTARTWQNTIRMAITQALANSGHEAMALTEFLDFLPRYWSDTALNPNAFDPIRFVCEFIAPTMLWFQDYAALQEQGALTDGDRLPDDVRRRLAWEVLAEFGYRARIGRSLERTGTVALGIELEPVRRAAEAALPVMREQLGVRDLALRELLQFMLGLLLYLKNQGGIYHRPVQDYIASGGNDFLWNRQQRALPSFGSRTPRPRFLSDLRRRSNAFDSLAQGWYQRWCDKTLGLNRLLPNNAERELYAPALKALCDAGVLRAVPAPGGTVWALDPQVLYLSLTVCQLASADQRSQLAVPQAMREALLGMPALGMNDAGRYADVPAQRPHWLSRMYRLGELRRVIAEEHTGLLERDVREKREGDFIAGQWPWSPNLLSATPTLEMGIDIGDLSTVLLCSVPPGQASYLQRIGRAGRRDGNAFNLTVAAAHPHDLYFYADPERMMAGRIEPPGVFLNAAAVIERQLTGFALDRWVAGGIDAAAIPQSLRPVLDQVEKGDAQRFPYNFLSFVASAAERLLDDFAALFAGELSDRTLEHLRHFLLGDDPAGANGLAMRLLKSLLELVEERDRLKKRIEALKRHLDKLERQPPDEATAADIATARRERAGLQAVLRSLNGKETLNFLTDEGLVPNYAFPEAGVTLRSVIYRKRTTAAEDGSEFDNLVYEYERPGASAISEFAPLNRFYAGGRQVRIEQVDLALSPPEDWRFCPSCTCAIEISTAGDHHAVCPRCHDPMWADSGQRAQMVRLRQVMASSSDRASRIGDDSEEREPLFYTRQVLADFAGSDIEVAYRIASDALPFGFEFVRNATFREINFGQYGLDPMRRSIAGVAAARPGFRLCRHCGRVQERHSQTQSHAFACKAADPADAANLLDCLYLYREFSSEAIRILLPSAVDDGGQALNSFIAAIQLGLRRQFGGQVDHLRMMSYDESPAAGGARRYLMLYDTVPGGTGYLRELMRAADHLLDVFRLARAVMVACECNQDLHRDGCYHCLYAYRNSYGMETTSRTAAVTLLSAILQAAERFERVASIGDIAVNPILESALEARFVEGIKRLSGDDIQIQQQIVRGKPGYFLRVKHHHYTLEPQASLGLAEGVQCSSRPDFLIRSARAQEGFKPMAVFLDGYQYHKNIVTEDSAKRLALVQSGAFWQWSLTWQDVNATAPLAISNPFQEQPTEWHRKLIEAFELQALGGVTWQNGLQQLLGFLGQPEPQRWAALAFVRALSWFHQDMQSPAVEAAWQHDFALSAATALQQCLDDRPAERAYGSYDQPPLRILCAVPLAAIKEKRPALMVCNMLLDTAPPDADNDAAFRAAWQNFLRAYNLLQFLPATGFATTAGSASGRYETLPWRWAQSSLRSGAPTASTAQEAAAHALIGEADAALREGLQALLERGLALPEVAFELQNAAGEIIAEAELAWPDRRIAGLLKEQLALADLWRDHGWSIVELTAAGWVESVMALLQEAAHG